MGKQAVVALNEETTKLRLITPAIMEQAGWGQGQIFMEHTFTDGRVIVRGETVKRGARKMADYLLVHHEAQQPLAVVEAKDERHSVGDGMQQAIEYAVALDVPFAYSSNGHGFLEHDFFTGTERMLAMHEFPTNDELWQRYIAGKGLSPEQQETITEPYYFDPFSGKAPRYYQRVAIDRTVESISKGESRALLVMATGTGKTYTAFQIIWRLMKGAGQFKRVLYLADRNILIDQTMQQDFKPFEKVMTKVRSQELDSSYEIYMSLYHQLVGDEGTEPFRDFKPEFFDLIIVDECHRGSAKANSRWRRVLDYFTGAVHIGMTATPKENQDISNSSYFGDPIYTYSLKQGIDDGFLAPYKVFRVGLDKDLEGWRPERGQTDIDGNEIEDREYNSLDFDKTLVIDERTQRVAERVTAWLNHHGRLSKTIIFCVDIEHAERMRQAMVNANRDLTAQNPRYVMRITGDNQEGKNQLDNFIDVNESYPTVVTTSKLMTTGVDTKTVQLIVLDANINSMTEFKQIIGRGTRLYPDAGKMYFTVMDFRGVSRLFADPAFDGDPIVVYEEDDETPPEANRRGSSSNEAQDSLDDSRDKRTKVFVNGVEVTILNERVQYYDQDGRLTVESIVDYSRRNILGEFATLEHFISAWRDAEKKQAIISALEEQGVLLDALRDDAGKASAELDPFDLILHIAYDQKPVTKRERIDRVKKQGYLYKYSDVCRAVLEGLLDKYMNEGITDLKDTRILGNAPFDRLGSPARIARMFGGKQEYLEAVRELERAIYGLAA
ncbi:restriction endonuclease subunit R [Arthrobacter crusticola]|uniref:Restriction endonuclease subunit R n=1 Tax=Arthrobacter crusticola TaxID=2547960 RepID=A0A4R5TSS7_9MICC|nr:DEAD/DEAH box helicase family protein [Arthrobacter crusticola]TDK23508.1 restriction endonuclease subunit R [Arthrobacter crusticola]